VTNTHRNHTPPAAIDVHDDVPDGPAAIIDAGLHASNLAAAASLQDVQGLSCFAHAPSGQVIGGAIGRTWGACCELQQLWVHEAHRRQGLGAALVSAFHARAETRGCQTFYLTTFSFQAPRLYQSLGYQMVATVDGFAPGVRKHTMVRQRAGP
jgi:GNAT superfamily N-acetyltransferase